MYVENWAIPLDNAGLFFGLKNEATRIYLQIVENTVPIRPIILEFPRCSKRGLAIFRQN